MPDISDYVRLNIPETLEALTDAGKGGLTDAVSDLTSRILSQLGIADEAALVVAAGAAKAEFAKGYVGDLVTRMLIPPGIDYWATQARLSDTTTLPAGFTPGGGETTTFYDKVRALEELDALIAARLAASAPLFADILDPDDGPVAAFGVSAKKALTQDPQVAWDRIDACLVEAFPFGVQFPVTFTEV